MNEQAPRSGGTFDFDKSGHVYRVWYIDKFFGANLDLSVGELVAAEGRPPGRVRPVGSSILRPTPRPGSFLPYWPRLAPLGLPDRRPPLRPSDAPPGHRIASPR